MRSLLRLKSIFSDTTTYLRCSLQQGSQVWFSRQICYFSSKIEIYIGSWCFWVDSRTVWISLPDDMICMRLRWFEQEKRRDQEYDGRNTLEMVSPVRRRRRRPKQRWTDCANRDMTAIGTTKVEVHGRIGWRRIRCERLEVGPTRRRSAITFRRHSNSHNYVPLGYPP